MASGTKLRRNPHSRRAKQSGMVLITMGAAALALLGALGMAVDMGRMFIAKNEAQAYADAHALSASLMLNGKSTGIDNAIAAVTSASATFNFSDNDRWNFNNCSFLTSSGNTCSSTTPTVNFATSSSGPWYADAAAVNAAGINYADIDTVKVVASLNERLYFVPAVLGGAAFTSTLNGTAIAGQVAITSFPKGLAPFTAVGPSTTGPRFGLTEGVEYTIQWPQYNSTRQHCSPGMPDNCFVRPPCPGDQTQTLGDVVQHWGAQTNGYWGFSSGSSINETILGTLQLQAVTVGTDIQPVLSNGNKASTANALDDRVNSDPINYANVYSTYLTTAGHNGRREIVVPIVHPTTNAGTDQTTVSGYGLFFLESSESSPGNTSNFYTHVTGNEGYCAIYAGPFNLGSIDNGSDGSTTGASRVRLLQ